MFTKLQEVANGATQALRDHMAALEAKGGYDKWDAEDHTRLDALTKAAEDAQKAHKAALKANEAASWLEGKSGDAPLNDTAPTTGEGQGLGDGGVGGGQKSDYIQGLSVKGGVVMAAIGGKDYEIMPEEALAGPTAAIVKASYRKAFVKWFRTSGNKGGQFLDSNERKALNEGNDQAGGYLVPADMQAGMISRTAAQSVMLPNVMVVPTSRDELVWNRLKENGTSAANGSIFSTGFVGGWAGETPAFTEVDPAFGRFAIPVKKARTATKLSNDLMADSVTPLMALLAQNGGENLGLVMDQGLLNGDGGSLQPTGLVPAGTGIETIDVDGTTTNTISNTAADLGSATKLIDLQYAVPSQYQDAARFTMHRLTEAKVRKLVDADGNFIWQPGFVGQPDTLLGKPVL
ncbi:MAG: phage major capsid protein, partial [Actinomycetota bacterium]